MVIQIDEFYLRSLDVDLVAQTFTVLIPTAPVNMWSSNAVSIVVIELWLDGESSCEKKSYAQ
jgi:hypothetical protein